MLTSAFGWYGGLIGGGMCVCIILAYFMAKRRGYDTDNVFDIAIICIPLAIIGARTYFVIDAVISDLATKGYTTWTFMRYIGFENGKFVGFAGLAIYGGLLGGIIGALIVRLINKRKPKEKQMTFIQMADMCFCLIILGQAIGRWGNYANQEVYGKLITDPAWKWFPFAVHIDATDEWHAALFFYESVWNFIGFGLLQWFYNGKRKSFEGFYFAFYCMWYGFIRFITEGLRDEEFVMGVGDFPINQLISFCIFLLGAGIIIYHLIMSYRAGKKPFLFVKEDELGPMYYGYEKSFFALKATLKDAKENAPAEPENLSPAEQTEQTEITETYDNSTDEREQ